MSLFPLLIRLAAAFPHPVNTPQIGVFRSLKKKRRTSPAAFQIVTPVFLSGSFPSAFVPLSSERRRARAIRHGYALRVERARRKTQENIGSQT